MVDPISYFLHSFVLRGFKEGGLSSPEQQFVNSNTRKHAVILYLNMAAGTLIWQGLSDTAREDLSLVINSLIAPVMILGTAWFTISFGGVPARLLRVAVEITWWMFTAFSFSLTAMFIAVAFAVSPLLWPVLMVIYIAAIVSCIQYDTADGLKAGLDDAILRHSRAALLYYKKQGVDPDETEA